MTTSTVTGRCLCGRVAYEVDGPVGSAGYRHCADCRRCTGSAFNVGVEVEWARLRFVAGTPRSFTKRGDSGNELTRHFCGDCGSPIFTSSPQHPAHVYVKAGTFDDPSIVSPDREIWTASAVPWGRVPAGMTSSAKG